jgi:sugar phosphate isomerase/epimerase
MLRRDFLKTSAAAPLVRSASAAGTRPVLCIFSKHMAQFDWADLADNAKKTGFEGVDLTVRPRGHVLPERVTEDLPRAVGMIRKAGLSVPMITTDLRSAADPAAKPTFAAMKQLGIPLYKPGYWRYRKEQSVAQAISEARQQFLGLLALGKEYGVTAGLHNHSGDFFGCSVWDLREVMAGADARDAGFYFDPGHATIEGGLYGWRVSLDLACERLKMVAMKDFFWEKKEGKWRAKWCPLGEGMVDWKAVFQRFAQAGFAGPVTLHVEYHATDEMAAIARDLAFMKRVVAESYA